LTAALIKDGNSHATTILAEVLEMIPNIDDQWKRAEIWRDLAEKLGEVDYEQLDSIFTKAITAAQEIDDPGWKRGALNDLASTLAGSGRYDEALAVAHAIEDSDVRLRALRDIAFYLVEKKRYAEALEVLGSLQPDEFIRIVACGAANADTIEPTLVSTGLREVLRILGWIFPDFQAVYEQVMTSED
jgi:tetratricopeptide (TPR) repeat protein